MDASPFEHRATDSRRKCKAAASPSFCRSSLLADVFLTNETMGPLSHCGITDWQADCIHQHHRSRPRIELQKEEKSRSDCPQRRLSARLQLPRGPDKSKPEAISHSKLRQCLLLLLQYGASYRVRLCLSSRPLPLRTICQGPRHDQR